MPECPCFVREYFKKNHVNIDLVVEEIEEIKSAQQRVLFVPLRHRHHTKSLNLRNRDDPSLSIEENMNTSMDSSRRKVVVRVWNGAARWWNLNTGCNNNNLHAERVDNNIDYGGEGTLELARAEVEAYRISRNVFQDSSSVEGRMVVESKSDIIIPEVLYFSHDDYDDDSTKSSGPYWALFSYVGKDSIYFPQPFENCFDEKKETTKKYIVCNENFTKQMVKVRHEFGFDEPHPRHGRVNEMDCLQYAFQLVDVILIPLHTAHIISHPKRKLSIHSSLLHKKIMPSQNNNNRGSHEYVYEPWSYHHMLEIYSHHSRNEKFEAFLEKNLSNHRLSLNNNNIDDDNCFTHDKTSDILVSFCHTIKLFIKCVQKLRQEETTKTMTKVISDLPPVLCHLDLQPQNLMFYDDYDDFTKEEKEQKIPKIRSVLDWEEAAFADPRFELLLICRKVCCNYEQAQKVWTYYQQKMNECIRVSDFASPPSDSFDLGVIDPWLKLEGLHSILTLLLQANILDIDRRNEDANNVSMMEDSKSTKGRGKTWETRIDLLEKIKREFYRLSYLGWDFCREELERI